MPLIYSYFSNRLYYQQFLHKLRKFQIIYCSTLNLIKLHHFHEEMERYVDRKRIKTESVALIYSAIDTTTNSPVAIKEVDEDLQAKPHDIKREVAFLKQQQSEAKGHNFLEFIDSFQKFDDIFLVTPLYDLDLQSLISKYRKKSIAFNLEDPSLNNFVYKNHFPVETATQIFISLTKTLDYLHNKAQIIHRDIKPGNIFFKLSDLNNPIIGDFGTIFDLIENKSEVEDDELTLKKGSNYNKILKHTDVCTGIYKPPELCLGKADYNHKIDLWSLGIVIQQLFSKSGESCLSEAIGRGDIALLHCIFQKFGTPSNDSSTRELYWPEMATQNIFTSFNFEQHERTKISELMPRAPDYVQNVWNQMMVYESNSRINELEAVESLSRPAE